MIESRVWVAAVRVSASGSAVLLAGHLEPSHTILFYRVTSFDAAP
jgi:hypothetical protein